MSASRAASSMFESEARISGGVFLLSLTYCSKWARRERVSASTSRPSSGPDSSRVMLAPRKDSPSSNSSTRARCPPSTSTFTVPSGELQELQDGGDRP